MEGGEGMIGEIFRGRNPHELGFWDEERLKDRQQRREQKSKIKREWGYRYWLQGDGSVVIEQTDQNGKTRDNEGALMGQLAWQLQKGHPTVRVYRDLQSGAILMDSGGDEQIKSIWESQVEEFDFQGKRAVAKSRSELNDATRYAPVDVSKGPGTY